jgi:hypothetical protein
MKAAFILPSAISCCAILSSTNANNFIIKYSYRGYHHNAVNVAFGHRRCRLRAEFPTVKPRPPLSTFFFVFASSFIAFTSFLIHERGDAS